MQTPSTPVMFTKPTDLRAPGAIDALLKFHHSVFGDMQMNGAAGGDAGGSGGSGGDAGGQGGGAGGSSGAGGDAGGQGGGAGGSGGDGGGSDDGADLGFPKDTPIKDMNAEQQAAYWKHQSQKHERAWKSRGLDMTPDEVKALRDENDELKRKTMSDSEKAIADARAEGERAGREAAAAEGKNNTLKLVDGYIDGFLNIQGAKREDHKDFLESLDLSKFITADGDIDTDRVANVIGGALGNRPGTQRWPDMGQGHRGGGAKTSGMDAGRAEAARRFEQNKQ